MIANLAANRNLVRRLKAIARFVGYDATHWTRVVMYLECYRIVEELGPEGLDVLEVGSGEHWREHFKFKSYTTLDYPEHDICCDRLDRTFDLVICDNVFEHLPHPGRAAENVFRMVRPGGHFLNVTPFLIRIHHVPIDCTRWTELGMSYFLEERGFRISRTGSWGNRAVVKANLRRLGVRRGFFRSLSDEKPYPVQIWVLAQRPA